MDEHNIRDLLKKYADNRCTDDEKQKVEQWYLNASSSAGQDQQIPDEDVLLALKEASWKEIKKRKRARVKTLKWIGSAAAAVILVVVMLWGGRVRNPEKEVITFVQLETGKDNVRLFVLPDSSRVWLNSGSRIRYNSRFNIEERELILEEGEAFFDVTHQPLKPFTVIAGNTKTAVLGTAFNIRSYHYLDERQISVARGKVQVETFAGNSKNGPEILLPGEQLAVDTASGRYQKRTIKAEDLKAWKEGLLQFNNETLLTISKMIENKFLIRSRFASDSISNLRFKASFKTNDPLKTILDDLSQAGNLDYRIEANEIIFSPKK